MSNKNTEKGHTKNNVFTPKEMEDAMNNLPHNYIVLVQGKIAEKAEGTTAKSKFSKNYITDVRKGEAFNEVVLETIIEVGLENFEKKKRFPGMKKKTPSTN